VTDLLRARIGLDQDALGPTVLPRAVRARMDALGLTAPVDYATRLTADAQEFQTLLGDLMVPETWFFRGGDLFPHLARHIAASLRQQPAKRFRILSVPCSTGEEPYSLALALGEAGVTPGTWSMDGIDLSSGHIESARRGQYGKFSFRQTSEDVRQRYFRPVEGRWELDPAIRALVRFRTGNLLDPLFLAGQEPFDLIFCRNLFIYLHLAARRQALATLDRLLAPRGVLCAGYAEPLEALDQRFQRTGPGGLFLYQRAPEIHGDRPSPPPPLLSRDLDAEPAEPAVPVAAPADLLGRARQQADAGRLDEALASCQAHLTHCGPSADAFSLMGVLYQARHETNEACRCFQRALYLAPDHRDALTHRMLLYREQGEHDQAARLWRRLQRIAPEEET
jgi:chemotaxis protein methyltransferase WspC